MLKELFTYHKITTQLGARLNKITHDGITAETTEGELTIKADQVILAIGYMQANDLPTRMYQKHPEKVTVIGDCKKVSNIMNAVYEGYEVGKNL